MITLDPLLVLLSVLVRKQLARVDMLVAFQVLVIVTAHQLDAVLVQLPRLRLTLLQTLPLLAIGTALRRIGVVGCEAVGEVCRL